MKQNIFLLLLVLFAFSANAQKNQLQPTTKTLYFGDINGFLGNIHQSKIKVKGYTGEPYKVKFDNLTFGLGGEPYNLNLKDLYYFNPLDFWKNNEWSFFGRNRDTVHTYLDWGISRMYIQSENIKIDSIKSYGESLDTYGFLNEEILENGKVKRHIINATPFFQPFYFKKTEVTNREYR